MMASGMTACGAPLIVEPTSQEKDIPVPLDLQGELLSGLRAKKFSTGSNLDNCWAELGEANARCFGIFDSKKAYFFGLDNGKFCSLESQDLLSSTIGPIARRHDHYYACVSSPEYYGLIRQSLQTMAVETLSTQRCLGVAVSETGQIVVAPKTRPREFWLYDNEAAILAKVPPKIVPKTGEPVAGLALRNGHLFAWNARLRVIELPSGNVVWKGNLKLPRGDALHSVVDPDLQLLKIGHGSILEDGTFVVLGQLSDLTHLAMEITPSGRVEVRPWVHLDSSVMFGIDWESGWACSTTQGL